MPLPRQQLVLAVALLGLAACSAAGPAGVDDRAQLARYPDRVELTRFRSDDRAFVYNSGILAAERSVVRDAAAWEALWERIWAPVTPTPPVAPFDPTTEMIVVAAMGQRNSGGHDIVIDSARAGAEGTLVYVRTTSAGRGCLVTAALTQPVDVAKLPKRAGTVEFRESSVVRDCQ